MSNFVQKFIVINPIVFYPIVFKVFDFMHIDQHPINQAFATFATIKRAVGLSRNKNSHTTTIGPATNTVRKFSGMVSSSHKETAKFSVHFAEGLRGCFHSWDSILGERWDILPGKSDESSDTLIKTLRFTEHRDFGLFTMRCHITTCEGRFRHEEDYRSIVHHNFIEASKTDSYLLE